MKSLVVLLALALLPAVSMATCEDGHSTAESAVAGQYRKLDPKLRRLLNCKISANENFETLRNGDEVYTVISVCGQEVARKTNIYSVVLHEVEDAVCVVKSVKLLGSQG